jgi:hypothetical protein
MLWTIRALLASGILFVAAPLTGIADDKEEMVDNPMYTAWAKHKPGANSTRRRPTATTETRSRTKRS